MVDFPQSLSHFHLAYPAWLNPLSSPVISLPYIVLRIISALSVSRGWNIYWVTGCFWNDKKTCKIHSYLWKLSSVNKLPAKSFQFLVKPRRKKDMAWKKSLRKFYQASSNFLSDNTVVLQHTRKPMHSEIKILLSHWHTRVNGCEFFWSLLLNLHFCTLQVGFVCSSSAQGSWSTTVPSSNAPKNPFSEPLKWL